MGPIAGTMWYHGTDSTETVSTTGLDAIVTRFTPGADPRGLFVTFDETVARAYAIWKTNLRIALGEIPPQSRPVVLAADESQIGHLLEDPDYAIGGEKFIPVTSYPRVPIDAFQRVWTG